MVNNLTMCLQFDADTVKSFQLSKKNVGEWCTRFQDCIYEWNKNGNASSDTLWIIRKVPQHGGNEVHINIEERHQIINATPLFIN